jgi:hypothetical protein
MMQCTDGVAPNCSWALQLTMILYWLSWKSQNLSMHAACVTKTITPCQRTWKLYEQAEGLSAYHQSHQINSMVNQEDCFLFKSIYRRWTVTATWGIMVLATPKRQRAWGSLINCHSSCLHVAQKEVTGGWFLKRGMIILVASKVFCNRSSCLRWILSDEHCHCLFLGYIHVRHVPCLSSLPFSTFINLCTPMSTQENYLTRAGIFYGTWTGFHS